MRVFARYLWKEWRDQRVVLLGALVAIPLLLALLVFVLPRSVTEDESFGMVTAFACLALAALAVGNEALPSESRRQTARLLARLPGGLDVAFAAKLCVVLATLIALPLYGWSIAAAFGASGVDPRLHEYMPGAFAVALWMFVVSSWLPRGALAIPATALTLGVMALPVYLVWTHNPMMTPREGALEAGIVLLTMGAVWAGWWSFARGRRFSRGAWGSSWRGLVATTVLFSPAWAYSAIESHDFHRAPDPQSERWFIQTAYIGTGQRFAFVTGADTRRFHPRARVSKPVVVDLRDGTWRAVGSPHESFRPLQRVYPASEYPVIALVDLKEPGNKTRHLWTHYFSGATGSVVKSGWSDMLFSEVQSLVPRLPRVAPDGYTFRVRYGWAVSLSKGSRRFLRDPFADKLYEIPQELRRGQYFVLKSGWLSGVRGSWRRFDPKTQERVGPEVPRPDWANTDT